MKISQTAYYIIQKYHGIKGGITPLKLQKLLYYLKVWGIVAEKELLVTGEFKAWKNGPVNPYIYHEFKEYGKQPIPPKHTAGSISGHKKEMVHFILDSYVHFDALTLSAMTHEEDPWAETPNNKIISNKVIKKFYSTQPFAQNFPLQHDAPYYPVYSDFMYSFIFDFQEDDAAKKIVFDSFEQYQQMMKQSHDVFKKHFAV